MNEEAERKEPSRPSPIDVHVGSRIRMRRTLMGMSQERLGEALGLTFQQVQKYERGANRVGASRLFDIARVLGVEVGFFYEEMGAPIAFPANDSAGVRTLHAAETQSEFGGAKPKSTANGLSDDLLHRRETLELVRTYYRITDPVMRRKVFDLIKTMVPKE